MLSTTVNRLFMVFALLGALSRIAAAQGETARPNGLRATQERTTPDDRVAEAVGADAIVANSSGTDAVDDVTHELFRQYVIHRGKIATSHVKAAIELVAARGNSPAFAELVLVEFETSCDDENARTVRRNLLELMSKILAVHGGQRWGYELALRSVERERRARPNGPAASPENDNVVYQESEMLERVIARGRQADRHDIDAFVLAVRQAHHPQGKQFLLDVLRNPLGPTNAPRPQDQPKARWRDSLGGTWGDAKFHAAVGLAELGEHAGVEWLILQSKPNDLGVGSMSASVEHAPHRKAVNGNLRESCLHALADLSGLPVTEDTDQWNAWWTANRNRFEPHPVALRIDGFGASHASAPAY